MTSKPRSRRAVVVASAMLVVATAISCTDGSTSSRRPLTVESTFERDADGWSTLFADHPNDLSEADYNLVGTVTAIPDNLGTGYLLGGTNRSDDLWMSIIKKVDGLEEGCYDIAGAVTLATNAPASQVGVGGAPGEAVTLKLGASVQQPTTSVDDLGIRRLNIDVGNQTVGGKQAAVVGSVESEETSGEKYVLKTATLEPGTVTVDVGSRGEAWILFGSDSGFEGRTEYYVVDVSVTFTPC